MSMSTVFILSVLLLFFTTLPCPSLSASERCHPDDKKVLLKIKKHWGNPYILASWDSTTDCCDWYCVKCDEATNRIFTIFVDDGDLPGPIPPFIADLRYLKAINLRRITNLTGPIPSTLTKLNYFTGLWLEGDNLTGTIPDFLGQLKHLTYINLANNKLTGPIPASLSQIPKLGQIELTGNRLTGSIPASLVSLKGNGLFLLLSNNQLSGTVPATFGQIDFGKLDLSRNKLEGDISMLLGPNKTTYHMDFSRNMLSFNMSKLKLHNNLVYLDVSHNKIYGSLPKAMVNLNWQFLNVSYNSLCGEIPQGGRLQSWFDYSSYFHNRRLCGAPLNVTCK